jgi:hypothetical protein
LKLQYGRILSLRKEFMQKSSCYAITKRVTLSFSHLALSALTSMHVSYVAFSLRYMESSTSKVVMAGCIPDGEFLFLKICY